MRQVSVAFENINAAWSGELRVLEDGKGRRGCRVTTESCLVSFLSLVIHRYIARMVKESMACCESQGLGSGIE